MSVESRVLKLLEKQGFSHRFISLDDLVFSPFTRFKCMQCANYHSTYGCPPFTPTWKSARKLLSRYDRLLLIWRYIDMAKYVDNLVVKHGMQYSPRVLLMAQTVCDRLAKGLDKHVLECADMLRQAGYDVLALLSGGGCRRCKRVGCMLWASRTVESKRERVEIASRPAPCRHGSPMMAMEAWGISVYDTLVKLGIDFEPVPRTRTVCVMLLAWRRVNSVDLRGMLYEG